MKKKKRLVRSARYLLLDTTGPVAYQDAGKTRNVFNHDETAYYADKWHIISRFALLACSIPLLVFIFTGARTNKIAGLVAGLTCCWLFFRYSNHLKAIFRLFDVVVLSSGGIKLRLLGKKAELSWSEVKDVKIDASLWDGIRYSIELYNGSNYVFTEVIKLHLDLYRKIISHIS